MAEVTRRRVGELQQGVLKVLVEADGSVRAQEAINEVEKLVPPTPFEQQDYPNHPGDRRYGKMVRFATIALVKAGWLNKSKGFWSITEAGKDAVKAIEDPEKLTYEARRLYKEWKAGQQDEVVDDEEPGESNSAILDEAEETAWAQVEQHLRTMPPLKVQQLVAALLRGMGYHVSFVAEGGPDKGIDVIAHNDPLGSTSPRIMVQVKRTGNAVDRKEVSSFLGSIGKQDHGIFVSIGDFTRDAKAEGRAKETPNLALINARELLELWTEHYERISEVDKKLLPLRPIYYLDSTE